MRNILGLQHIPQNYRPLFNSEAVQTPSYPHNIRPSKLSNRMTAKILHIFKELLIN